MTLHEIVEVIATVLAITDRLGARPMPPRGRKPRR
jgi:hypothetical protein